MATHSSILAWKIPWEKEPGRLQSMGHKELDTTERLDFMEYDLETSIKMLMHISLDPKIPLLEIYSTYIFP